MTAFVRRNPLRFAHCDPAGIAYYPRYLELCDGVIEDWSAEILGVPRNLLHGELGLALPTAELRADFAAVSRLGDLLDFTLTVERIGRSSIAFAIEVHCAGERRFGVRYTQVLTNGKTMRPEDWPPIFRRRIEESMQ